MDILKRLVSKYNRNNAAATRTKDDDEGPLSHHHVIYARNSLDGDNLGRFVSPNNLHAIVVDPSSERTCITETSTILENAPEKVRDIVTNAIQQILDNRKNTQAFIMHDSDVYFVDGFCLVRPGAAACGGVVFVRKSKQLPRCVIEYHDGVGKLLPV